MHWNTLPLLFFFSFLVGSAAIPESIVDSDFIDLVIESASDLSSKCSCDSWFDDSLEAPFILLMESAGNDSVCRLMGFLFMAKKQPSLKKRRKPKKKKIFLRRIERARRRGER